MKVGPADYCLACTDAAAVAARMNQQQQQHCSTAQVTFAGWTRSKNLQALRLPTQQSVSNNLCKSIIPWHTSPLHLSSLQNQYCNHQQPSPVSLLTICWLCMDEGRKEGVHLDIVISVFTYFGGILLQYSIDNNGSLLFPTLAPSSNSLGLVDLRIKIPYHQSKSVNFKIVFFYVPCFKSILSATISISTFERCSDTSVLISCVSPTVFSSFIVLWSFECSWLSFNISTDSVLTLIWDGAKVSWMILQLGATLFIAGTHCWNCP